MRIEGAGSGLIFADGSVVHNRAELIGPQGPQGIQGVQGPVGAVGPARTNRADRSDRSCWIEWLQPRVDGFGQRPTLNNSQVTVASVTVPAGNYFIFAKGSVLNARPLAERKLANCELDDSNEDQS